MILCIWKKTLLFIIVTLTHITSSAQLPYRLKDGRSGQFCESCNHVIQSKPDEVLFGIQINLDGEVYFSMNNRQWFEKILPHNSFGISVDLVSRDRYSCNNEYVEDGTPPLPKGLMLQPVYKSQLIKTMKELSPGNIYCKIGTIPIALAGKLLEGNLVIVNGNNICYYTNFVNIDRNVWQLLPMGLFTDFLLRNFKEDDNGKKDQFIYTQKMKLEIPFEKGISAFSNEHLKQIYDSLQLKKFNIKKVEIRSYTSVEGPEKTNRFLMERRAQAMITALKRYEPGLARIKVISAENWLEFFNDIEKTSYKELRNYSKFEIKQKLLDKVIAKELEPILSRHRKVTATIYLKEKSKEETVTNATLLSGFEKAVTNQDIEKARLIQKELANRVFDNKAPSDFVGKIEIPQTKEYNSLNNDREVYKYMLQLTSEHEALENFLKLQKLDPQNGRINYNICALRFFMWQYGEDSISKKILPEGINALQHQSIDTNLTKRMWINYYILMCEDQMRANNYAAKDSAITQIRNIYQNLSLSDEDIYSLAKYFTFYTHSDWAEEIITPRLNDIKINENLLFYYINLLLFHPEAYGTDDFTRACLSAINLDRKRFCDFFLPNDKGGASMQLLDYVDMKLLYCESCRHLGNN